MTTTNTTTGHTITIDAARMLLSIAGPTETMDAIPDAELHAAADACGLEWRGEAVDETTYRLHGGRFAYGRAANGTTYNGTTVGSGYDCEIVRVGTARGETLTVACITRVGTKCEWLIEGCYPGDADLQDAAVRLAQNPPINDIDVAPNEEAHQKDGWHGEWDEAAWDRLAEAFDDTREEVRQ